MRGMDNNEILDKKECTAFWYCMSDEYGTVWLWQGEKGSCNGTARNWLSEAMTMSRIIIRMRMAIMQVLMWSWQKKRAAG